MRFGLIAVILLGLAACVDTGYGPAEYAGSGWRSTTGSPLSIGEVAALRATCRPRAMSGPVDTDQPVANPIRDNPLYHPGGVGLANATKTGIGDPDRPLDLGFRRTTYTANAIDECLIEKGLVQIR
jgi:hypothetical protein